MNECHHNEMEREQRLEYAALAESASSHPIRRSLQRAYGKAIDRSRVTEVREIRGNGVRATADGIEVAGGNEKHVNKVGAKRSECKTG